MIDGHQYEKERSAESIRSVASAHHMASLAAADDCSAASRNRFTFRWTQTSGFTGGGSQRDTEDSTCAQLRFQREPSRLPRTGPQTLVDVKHQATKSGQSP